MQNIAICGYGKMGKLIKETAEQAGHDVCAVIDPESTDNAVTHHKLTKEAVKAADVVIDFTIPKSAVPNVRIYSEAGVSVVMGTTGWYDRMGEVETLVDNAGIGMIWSGNFSLGVNALFALVRYAGKVMNNLTEYDCMVHEYHHRRKADSPSGTAEMIGNILLEQLDSKEKMVVDALHRPIEEDELHVSSTRGGSIPGTHTISFDSPVDTIEIRHTARGREGFAAGAVKAAQWIASRKGLYSIDAMMKNMIGVER
ncbi:MAG: 4-hydroxy-tetrahydrodipicolinate reductase [Spirochaetota bacterium]